MNEPTLPEPTTEQCYSNTEIVLDDGRRAVASGRYPSMGGYKSRSWLVYERGSDELGEYGCFDVAIWHDGQFPFVGVERGPVWLHHCDPDEFIDFGKFVKGMMERKGNDDMGEDDAALLEQELTRFRFHPAVTKERQEAHQRVRNICADTLAALWEIVPASNERDQMVNALDDACMWANAAIARNDPHTAESTSEGMEMSDVDN